MIQIKGVLDCYALSGTMDGKVPPMKNKEGFLKMLFKFKSVIRHEYHGPKLERMLKAWAEEA